MESTILRIYMPVSAKVKSTELSFWQRLLNGSLASFLLGKAKEFGIEQSLTQRISVGYLKGKRLVTDFGEVIPPDLPQCVEMIDTEEKLRSFFEKYKSHLEGCRVVLFKTAQLIN